jgi:hypothetical protein
MIARSRRCGETRAWGHLGGTGNTLVLITFDEGQGGTTGENCAAPSNTDPSCHIATIAAAAGVQPVHDATFYTH